MRKEKPLPKESTFKEFSANNENKSNNSGARGSRKPAVNSKFKKMFNEKDEKPDRRNSRGNSFKEDRSPKGMTRSRPSPISNAGPKEMFDAVCSKCHKPCKVPFKPTSGKPISCSDCFVKKDRYDSPTRGRSGGFQSRGRDDRNAPRERNQFGSGSGFQGRTSSQRFARTDSGVKELFDAVCMKCGNKCKVPFKPTTGKGVSCSNCFVKKESSNRGRSNSGQGRSSSRENNSRDNSRGRR